MLEVVLYMLEVEFRFPLWQFSLQSTTKLTGARWRRGRDLGIHDQDCGGEDLRF